MGQLGPSYAYSTRSIGFPLLDHYFFVFSLSIFVVIFSHDDLIFRFCVYRSKEFVLEPTKLTDFKGMTVIRISCGAHHSIAIVEDKSTGIDKVPFPSLPPLATAAVVDD